MGTIHLHTLYDLPIGLKRAFSKILGMIYRNMMCQIFFKNFSHFWVKVTHCIWVLSQLTCWIFISHVFNYNSWNLAYFLRPYTLESPKLHNSIYTKLTFKVCTVFWIGVYYICTGNISQLSYGPFKFSGEPNFINFLKNES